MYWNIVKRDFKTIRYIKIVKTFNCFGINDYKKYHKAKIISDLLNKFEKVFKRYYYKVEFDFE